MSELPITLTDGQKYAFLQTLELTGNYELVAYALMYVVDPVSFMASDLPPKVKTLAEYIGTPIIAIGEQS